MESNINSDIESRSIPGEHSNQTLFSIQQNEDEDDYFVYKLGNNLNILI